MGRIPKWFGTLAARQPEGHDRRLHASSQLPKEGGTKQVGKDGQGSWHEVNAASQLDKLDHEDFGCFQQVL